MFRIQMIANLVWEFRQRAEAWWPTPPTDDALRFALCEAAEALDAVLRANPRYARNHERAVDLRAELAQCAIMLVTALGADWNYGGVEYVARDNDDVDEAVRFVCNAFGEFIYSPRTPTWRIWAECALIQIARVFGDMQLAHEVEHQLAIIESKHLPDRLRQSVAVCARVVGRREEGDDGTEIK